MLIAIFSLIMARPVSGSVPRLSANDILGGARISGVRRSSAGLLVGQ